MRDLFRFAPIHATDILVVFVAGVAGVLWFEAYKMIAPMLKGGAKAS
jgi:hypothetical protein